MFTQADPTGIYQSAYEALYAAPKARDPQHPDDAAVDRFATAMKSKLAKKRAEGRGGWEDKEQCGASFLSQLLREHVEKGDPLDVGNLAMMLHQRGEAILAAPQASEAVRNALAVWYGSMPESNGRKNWTAILYRKGEVVFDGPHITIDRSEYPDRVRYEADRVRYLIGEIDEEPWILDYDADKCDAPPQADKDGGGCAKGGHVETANQPETRADIGFGGGLLDCAKGAGDAEDAARYRLAASDCILILRGDAALGRAEWDRKLDRLATQKGAK